MLKNSLLIMFGYAKRTLPAGLITLVICHRGGAVRARSHHASAAVPGNACTGGRHRGYVGLAVMEQAFHISEQQAARRAEQEGRE